MDMTLNSQFTDVSFDNEELFLKYYEEFSKRLIMKYDCDLEELFDSILDNPSEFYINFFNSMSLNDRRIVESSYKAKTCYNCTNGSCKIEYYDKNDDITACFGWENPELISRQRIFGRF